MRYRHQLLHLGRQSSFQISLGWKTRLTSNKGHLHLHFGCSFEIKIEIQLRIKFEFKHPTSLIYDWRQNQNVTFIEQLWPGCLCSINLLGAVLSTKEGRRRRHLSDKTLATCATHRALLTLYYCITYVCPKKQQHCSLVFVLVLLQFAYPNSRHFNCVFYRTQVRS